MAITHSKVSAKGDGGDSSLVRPSDWNDDHAIGNGTITEAHLSISDNTTKDVSTSAHGFCPKAPNDDAKFLCGDASWDYPPGMFLHFAVLADNPADSTTYYVGGYIQTLNTYNYRGAHRLPVSGEFVYAEVLWTGAASSSEDISVYLRTGAGGGIVDTLIQTVGNTDAGKTFKNTSLSVSVSDSDPIQLKIVTPAWSTNPTSVSIGGLLYFVPD